MKQTLVRCGVLHCCVVLSFAVACASPAPVTVAVTMREDSQATRALQTRSQWISDWNTPKQCTRVRLSFSGTNGVGDTIYVSPDGGRYKINGVMRDTETVSGGLALAQPGTVLQFAPATYRDTIVINDIRPPKHAPIVLRGSGDGTTFTSPYTYESAPDDRHPSFSDYACIKIDDSTNIVIENFRAVDCWPSFVYTQKSNYITLRGSRIIGSQHVFYARGRTRAHHFLIEGNHWTQDPSNRMWTEIDWEDSHEGPYNGGLFGSYKMEGNVIVRSNLIENAFNGIRMKAKQKKRSDNPKNPEESNRNVEIYENSLYNTRDNCFEPDTDGYNWWVHHNFIKNAHKPWSLAQVDSGYWYFFANTGYFDDRPSGNHSDGGLLKVDDDSPYADYPTYFFNNSFYLRYPVARNGKLKNFNHWNNAYEFCRPQDHKGNICQSTPQMLVNYAYSSSQSWDFDAIDLVDFPAALRNRGQESYGLTVGQTIFNDAISGDLRLPPGSPLVDAGNVLSIPDVGWNSTFEDAGPDIGAYENGKLIEGPAYRNRGREAPRVVRITYREGSDTIRFDFSVKIRLDGSVSRMVARYGNDKIVSMCTAQGHALSCPLTPPDSATCDLPDEITLPDNITNTNGDSATLWGAVVSVLR